MNMRTSRDLLAAITVAAAATGANAQVEELLLIDLTVPNQITITTTNGASAASVSGSDGIGVYLENFYNTNVGGSISESLVSTDFTSVGAPTNNAANLFRISTDSGLNIFSWSGDLSVTLTAGQQAFSGSGTWTVPADDYSDLVNGNTSGNLYFPADTADDVSGASLIGTWRVIPAPSTAALLGLGGLAAVRRRR